MNNTMTKQKNILFISVILVLLILTIIVVVAKISPYRCCACPPADRYMLYPMSFTLLENHWSQYIDCHCPPEMGCVLSFWVIPIDLIGLVALLSAIFFHRLKKK